MINILSKRHLLIAAVLIAICIPPLLSRADIYENTGRWFFESLLFSSGQIPYKDFTWQYPPLGIVPSTLFLIVFGKSTLSLYAAITFIALALAAATYKIFRAFGIEYKISLLWTATFFAASNMSPKIIGSVMVFTPSWPIGLGGLLLLVLGASKLLVGKTASGRAMVVSGVAIGLLTKPEFTIATFALFSLCAVFWLSSKRTNRATAFWFEMLKLMIVGAVISGLIYGVIAVVVGSENLIAGIGGYGQSASRIENLVAESNSIFLSLAEETFRGLAGTAAITTILILNVIRYRSNSSRYPLLYILYIGTVIAAISIPGELWSRGRPLEAFVISLFGFVVLAYTTLSWRSAVKKSYYSSLEFRLLLLLAASISGYEILNSIGDTHEILIMAPLRFSPLIPVVATVWFLVHYLRNRKPENLIAVDQRILLMIVSVLAAGMQFRFIAGLGSRPEYTLAVLAALLLIYHFWIDPISKSIGKFNLPVAYRSIPSVLIVAVLLPTIVLLGVGRPVLEYAEYRQTVIQTALGPVLVRGDHERVIREVKRAVENSTSEGSAVISTSYIPWVNLVTDRPGILPVTQLLILSISEQQISDSTQSLEASPPALVVEDLVNDNGTEFGLWATNSRSTNPWLWEYIDENYEYCAKFIESEAMEDLWGARFYVQQNPNNSAPDCPTFRSVTGLNP